MTLPIPHPLWVRFLSSLLVLVALFSVPSVDASLFAASGPRGAPDFGNTNAFTNATDYVGLNVNGAGVRPLKLADLNGDMFVDVLGLRADGTLQAVFWNTLTYNFSLTATVATGVRHAVAADFNADGVTDVIAFADSSATLYLGSREGSFSKQGTLPSYPGWSAVASALVFYRYGNLVPDLLLLNKTNGNRSFDVYTNNADRSGTLTHSTWTPSGCTVSSGLSPAYFDVNGDCLPDLVLPCVGSGGGTDLRVWYRKGGDDLLASTTPSASWTPFSASLTLRQLVFGDFAAQGTMSVLAVGSDGSLYYVANAHGTGGYGDRCGFSGTPSLRDAVAVPITDSSGQNAVRLNASTQLHLIDYNFDGLPDLFAVSDGTALMLKNTYSNNALRFQAQRAPTFNTLYSVQVTSPAAAYDTDQTGRQDLVLGTATGTQLWYNTIQQSNAFLTCMVLDAAPYQSQSRPFSESAGSTSLVAYQSKQGLQKHACSQCPQSGSAQSIAACQCFDGLNAMLNYVEELAVGAGHAHRSWTNLLPNSFAVVYPLSADSANQWKLQYYTKKNIGSIAGVIIVLASSMAVLAVTIVVLMWRESREDKKARLARDPIYSFSS